jgi:phytoene desaturase
MRYSMSLFVMYFGTDSGTTTWRTTRSSWARAIAGLLDDIFTRKSLSDDFSLYLHRPTATDPSLAPPGCDSWYVLSPVPNLAGKTDWRRPRVRIAIASSTISSGATCRAVAHIVTEHTIDPCTSATR